MGEDDGADPNEIVISSNKFSVDYAKRGTAKCRKCKKAIEKDLFRIGKYTIFKEKKSSRNTFILTAPLPCSRTLVYPKIQSTIPVK